MKEAEQAFEHIVKLDQRDRARSMTAYRFRAHMLQCMGQHAPAAEVLTRALAPLNGKPPQEQRVECLYLRGASDACLLGCGLIHEMIDCVCLLGCTSDDFMVLSPCGLAHRWNHTQSDSFCAPGCMLAAS